MQTEEYSVTAKGEFFYHPFLPHLADPDHSNCGLLKPEFDVLTAQRRTRSVKFTLQAV